MPGVDLETYTWDYVKIYREKSHLKELRWPGWSQGLLRASAYSGRCCSEIIGKVQIMVMEIRAQNFYLRVSFYFCNVFLLHVVLFHP